MDDHLYRMDFSAEELKRLPEVHAAFMVSSCLAVNDITIFQRLFLMALNAPNFKGQQIDQVLSEYASTQALVIQRTLSGRLKEYLYMCHQYQMKCKRHNDTTLSPFLDTSVKTCANLKAIPGYQLAEWYRNKVTHHYIINDISTLLQNIETGLPFQIYLHNRDGNNGYFLGEHILRHKLSEIEGRNEIKTLNEFQDWVLHAASAVQSLHHEYCSQFIEAFFPDKMIQETPIKVPEGVLAKPAETMLPFFWDFRDRSDESEGI